MRFDLPTERTSIIKVIGVGGGGSNAVNHMYNQGIAGVDFIVCNTDQQALDMSPVPIKIQLGSSLTDGRGAGSIAEVGKNAAIENIDEIREHLENNTKMVFVTAGMGGGTGTGAAPVIAQAARELGILTVGIVTIPFAWEGRKRKEQAELGLEKMRESVDTLLVICNDRLREMYGNLDIDEAFDQADNVLKTAAKGIAEVITKTGKVNVDFEDVKTVMSESGVAIMGSAAAEGEGRAIKAVQEALSSPLLNDNDISGARYVLLNITYGGTKVLMDEISDITDYIQDEAGSTADVIWGHGHDETLGDEISVTIIATGFNASPDTGFDQEVKRTVRQLDEDLPTMITKPIESPTEAPVAEEAPAKEETREEREAAEEPFLKTEEDVSSDVSSEAMAKDEATAAPLMDPDPTPEPVAETPGEITFEINTPEPEATTTEEPDAATEEAPSEEKSTISEPMSFSFSGSEEAAAETTEEPVAEEPAEEKEIKRYYLDDDMAPEEPVAEEPAAEEPAEEMVEEPAAETESEPEPEVVEEPVAEAAEEPVAETTEEPVAEAEEEEEEEEEEMQWGQPISSLDQKKTAEVEEKEEEPAAETVTDTNEAEEAEEEVSPEEQQKLANERIARIKELSMKLKTPSGISDLEQEPAYKRRNIELDNTQHSSESEASRMSLNTEEGEDGEERTGLSDNNSFLHDNVD